MHEISLCESIRDLIEDRARIDGFARVNRVWVEVGPLSCVEPEALRFGFDAVMRGSVAEGATLDIDIPPAEGRCPLCGEVATMQDRLAACPSCGTSGLEVVRGDELKIRKLEVV